MEQYTDQQLQNVREHCHAEIEARHLWASNLSEEWQAKLSMAALAFANDVLCIPPEQQANRLLNHWYRRSHDVENGHHLFPDVKRQWDAALEGEPFEGEFSFFINSYPRTSSAHNFNIAPPGC